MALIDQIDPGAGFVDSVVRMSNTTGTPLVSAVDSDSGELIADEYTLTLSAVGGGTGTATVGTSSINNPFRGKVVTGVSLDDTTVYTDVIPGVSIVFSSTGANGNVGSVKVGSYFGDFASSGVGDGVPSTGVRHKVVNTSGSSVSEAKARLLTQAIQVKKTGSVFSKIGPFADGATEKVAGGGSSRVMPYVLTVSNTAGSGPTKTCDLSVDGVVLPAGSVRDRTTGIILPGTGLKAIDLYSYMIVSGPLIGFAFNIDPDCVNGDIANVMIFTSRYTQIAPDLSGTAGAYGTSDVDLTQDGQDTGMILAGEAAYYWARVVVPGSSNSESNPYPANVALSGVDSGSAGW